MTANDTAQDAPAESAISRRRAAAKGGGRAAYTTLARRWAVDWLNSHDPSV